MRARRPRPVGWSRGCGDRLGGHRVQGAEDFKIYAQLTLPGTRVHLTVLRRGKITSVSSPLGQRRGASRRHPARSIAGRPPPYPRCPAGSRPLTSRPAAPRACFGTKPCACPRSRAALPPMRDWKSMTSSCAWGAPRCVRSRNCTRRWRHSQPTNPYPCSSGATARISGGRCRGSRR